MLKISRRDDPRDGATLKAEGTLGGAWVRELRVACDAVLGERGRASLDLSGVAFVDRAGSELLTTLRDDPRIEILGVSGFVAELLKGGAA